jgi:PKD repeat protein
MKKIAKFIFMAFAVVLMMTACSPDDNHLLGESSFTADQVSFTCAPSATNANIIIFTNTSTIKIPTICIWDLGNGVTSKDASPRGLYPEAGSYTVSLTVTSADGTTATKQQTITIAKDDPTLFDTPAYRNLTGGADNANGKTWVFDQYNLYTAEVKAALDKDIRGHMGLGAPGSASQGWWGAGANEKSFENTLASVKHGWKLYDWKLTFSMAGGLKLKIETAGEGYGRNSLKDGFPYVWNNNDDMAFPYSGGNYTFSLNEAGEFPALTLPGGAFTGYYVGTQVYDIIYLTGEVMALRAPNSKEDQDWVFIYVREDLNKKPASVVKTLKTVPIYEDFEGAELTAPLKFDYEAMGGLTNQHYQNPAPVPINQSGKVFLYQKGSGNAGYWANVSYTTTDYLFDLTTQNKIRMKVYLPGYNDYTTAGQGEDWAPKTLQKMVAVKLQDSSKGGNAYQTQTQKDFTNLPTDKWINLIFDFSDVANRQDYDKIVIQFGGEGHNRTGIFFFDDLEFGDEFEADEVIFLTGGKNNENGKSWKLRSSTQGGPGIILTRAWTGEVWWPVDEKTNGAEAAYDDVLTFVSNGKAKLVNNGNSFMNESFWDNPFTDWTDAYRQPNGNPGSFVTKQYTPATDAKWSFTNIDGVSYLKLEKVFPMYAVNPASIIEGLYEIISLSADLIRIKFVSGPGEWDGAWDYFLVPAK